MRRPTIGIVLLASLLLIAAPASAVYVVTPLRATASEESANVGDTVEVTIAPENETTAAQWASERVHAYYAYDTAESSDDPDAASSDATYKRVLIDDTLTLDAEARGTLQWKVPAEVDDHNVAIRIESPEGELLAIADIAVGDAPPVMRALAGSDGGAEPLPPAAEEEQAPQADEKADVPAVGALAAAAVVAIAALAMRRRVG